MAALLSLLIIYMGVGTYVTHCLHHDKVQIGVPMACMKHCNHQGGISKKSCMEYVFMKLSPTSVAKQQPTCPSPVATVVKLFKGAEQWLLSAYLPHNKAALKQVAPHAPPRLYLAIIRILVI